MKAAVVGHVEWIDFVRVDRLPGKGEIVHASQWWEEPGGGGAAAAEQLRKLTSDAMFFTALGDDERGESAYEDLTARGLKVHAARRSGPTRRGVTHIDATGERTITVLGERLGPSIEDPLPWDELADCDVVYFTAGDERALAAARKARVLVATSRVFDTLCAANVELDALVGSALDPTEAQDASLIDPPPRLVVWTEGERGGSFTPRGGITERWEAVPLPGPVVDRYGAGDAFAASLAYGLATTGSPREAVRLAARCGAAVLTGRGPYEGQLTAEDLG
ncbi:MAG: ribokinase [Actinomycetota bacterium]|nr:ribokinase [Actinomycetota bacterium]